MAAGLLRNGSAEAEDAHLLEMNFPAKDSGIMRIHAWNMTNQLDPNGYFILDQHAIVTLLFEGVSAIECVDYDMIPGIILDLTSAK
ncbi:hypothetical protein [Rhizobium sp. SYY.PMSO]|uniref:hypothetical protein n=1 Tax=Rhizobium sp. SYY.PMSO TaxID=3382192 RepID=UPI0039902A2B